ncbi:MAG: phenol hydroxylase [Gammaproteobacteria bacterium]|jgi:phenol hydroxylase P4 protein|nr:MAG: phenol hydroxylase [Gammaproteobacteria bacterium]PHR82763.1 MAG: phenol hydroxylase [Colwellia sp.]
MATKTNFGTYPVGNKDAIENFHGNQLVYIAWDDHLSVGPANVFPLPPEMPFGALISEVIPSITSFHPDFEKIDWDKVQWNLDGKTITPVADQSIADNGVSHKSLLRFKTPDLKGYQSTGN